VDFEKTCRPARGAAVVAALEEVRRRLEELVARPGAKASCCVKGLRVAIRWPAQCRKSSLPTMPQPAGAAIVADQPRHHRDLVESELVLEGCRSPCWHRRHPAHPNDRSSKLASPAIISEATAVRAATGRIGRGLDTADAGPCAPNCRIRCPKLVVATKAEFWPG